MSSEAQELKDALEGESEALAIVLQNFFRACYGIAELKGWHDRPRQFPEIVALIHSEVSEALEAWREGDPLYEVIYGKPEGVFAELADVIIRIGDYVGGVQSGAELLAEAITAKCLYNLTREYRHGGKLA